MKSSFANSCSLTTAEMPILASLWGGGVGMLIETIEMKDGAAFRCRSAKSSQYVCVCVVCVCVWGLVRHLMMTSHSLPVVTEYTGYADLSLFFQI